MFCCCGHLHEADLVLPLMQFISYYGLVPVPRQSFLSLGNQERFIGLELKGLGIAVGYRSP